MHASSAKPSPRLAIHDDLEVGVIYTHEDDFMTPLLSSLARSGDGLDLRLMLVDNASESGCDRWTKFFPRTTVIRNERRLGYGPNLNRILALSAAEFTLLLNTDMHFEPDEQMLAKLVRFMRANPDVGVCGCRLYHADGSYAWPARRFLSLRKIAARRLGLERWLGREVDHLLYRERSPQETFDCDWLSGCLLMVRRDAYLEVGGFDEGFRKYFEDVDLCLRMRIAGWRVAFHGETFGYHLEQRASKRLFSHDARVHLQSYLRWLWKWGLNPARHIPRPKGVETPERIAA